jgi:hypothetical protein
MGNSYLATALKKKSYGGPSIADQLEVAKKSGNRNFVEFLQAERNAELSAEAKTQARIEELTKLNAQDAIEAEQLRVNGLLTLPDEDAISKRLNDYCEKLADKPAMHKATEEDWRVLTIATIPEAQTLLQSQNHAPMDGKEIEMVVRYVIANGLYLGDYQSFISAFFNLKNHGVIRKPVAVAVPVETREPTQAETVQAEIARLTVEADKMPPFSRERSAAERNVLRLQTMLETLGDSDYSSVINEIVNATGLQLSGENSWRFRSFLDTPAARKRYGAQPDRKTLRAAFATFFGNDSFLLPQEKEELEYQRQVEAMSSDDIARAVGRVNSYAPRPHSGIRQ